VAVATKWKGNIQAHRDAVPQLKYPIIYTGGHVVMEILFLLLVQLDIVPDTMRDKLTVLLLDLYGRTRLCQDGHQLQRAAEPVDVSRGLQTSGGIGMSQQRLRGGLVYWIGGELRPHSLSGEAIHLFFLLWSELPLPRLDTEMLLRRLHQS
jgi:hypothetical protein